MLVLREVVDQVATVTLNRPEARNALSGALTSELDDVITELNGRDDVACIILTGADPAFCAGIDLKALGAGGLGEMHVASGRGPLPERTKPLIGAINGLAYGGAALLSSILDLRIGCERTQFGFLAASYGRVNSTWSLPLLVGLPKAKELL